jgi:hypothetical protein
MILKPGYLSARTFERRTLEREELKIHSCHTLWEWNACHGPGTGAEFGSGSATAPTNQGPVLTA